MSQTPTPARASAQAEPRRTSTVSEAAGEVRWARSISDPTKPWVLQQYWKVTEHYADTSARTRFEWRDVKVVPPESP